MPKGFAILFLLVLPVKLDRNVKNTKPCDYYKEYYTTSVLGLIKLFELERDLMENFVLYADALQEKVNNLNSYLDAIKRPRYTTHTERETFVSDPVNAFGLIRRLKKDWPKLQNYSQKSVGSVHLSAMTEILARAPDDYDMNEALQRMHRIETTYDLQAKDIANGLLQSQQFNYKLISRDCLVIAQHKFKFGDYQRSQSWFKAALELKTVGNENVENEKNSFKSFLTEVVKRAVSRTNQSLENESLQQLVNKKFQSPKAMEEFISSKLTLWNLENTNSTNRTKTPPLTTHNIGCRGLFPKRTNGSLVCRYNSTTTPFLKLAPLKMEEISLDPYLVMYHEVISNREIQDLKEEITEMANGWADSRDLVSRIYWTRKESAIRDRINRRIIDITGFDVQEFPALQLANFGVGGYFRPHHDYFSDRIFTLEGNNPLGDRIGSLLIYVGDVSQGGQTLFPEIEVAVEPEKGNALFWFNTFDDATQDPRSLHSVCPVIVGSRWTVTKWLHYAPQLFVKRCYPKV